MSPKTSVEVHRIVIFTIRPDTGFAGYLKKIRPDTEYFIQFEILNTRMSARKDQIYSFRRHHILATCEVIRESRHIIIYSILYINN